MAKCPSTESACCSKKWGSKGDVLRRAETSKEWYIYIHQVFILEVETVQSLFQSFRCGGRLFPQWIIWLAKVLKTLTNLLLLYLSGYWDLFTHDDTSKKWYRRRTPCSPDKSHRRSKPKVVLGLGWPPNAERVGCFLDRCRDIDQAQGKARDCRFKIFNMYFRVSPILFIQNVRTESRKIGNSLVR